MRLGFIIFVSIVSLLIISTHVALLISIVNFFHLGPGLLRRILLGAIFSLSVSFIATLLLVHWRENLLTRISYLIASGWLGIFLYLLLATVVCWIVVLVIKTLGIEINSLLFATPVYLAAVVFSLYGFWNAANPVVKNISVKIENLPDQWKGRTIVQASDIHVGAINRAGFMRKVVDLINSAKPDAVMITGDLFDGAGLDLNHLVEPLNQIQAPLGVYFITGNHETYLGVQRSLDALRNINLRILRDEIVDLDGIQLVGIDFPANTGSKSLDSLLAQVDRHKPCIVLYHIPALVDTMKQLGVDLQLAGHTHRGQLWPFNYITKRVYDGLDYGLYTDGSYNLYTSCGAGTWGPPLRSGNRPEVVAIRLE
jgi:predicted MPP superfamily phosphohydrolase